MKQLILTSAIAISAIPTIAESKLTMEEHSLQAMSQMLDAQEKSGGGTIRTVGDDVNCDVRLGTTRIQDAINGGFDEIRIASSTYNENLTIDDISIIIKGGYATCTDALNDNSSGTQTITGVTGSTLPTISISGDTQRNTVTLENLQIQNGEGSGFFAGGGVSTLLADVALNFNNVFISLNEGILGGGLAIVGGSTDVTMTDTAILNNTAGQGGGIYCSSADGTVFINSGTGVSGIFNNTATSGNGGGVNVTAGCSFTSYDGRPQPVGFLDTSGIVGNSATGNGGGVFVDNGTVNLNGGLFCIFNACIFGDNNAPLNVDFNTADSDDDDDGFGGGIYATGSGSFVNVFNGLVKDNSAQSGGGIAIENEATLNMRSTFAFNTCWSPGSCSQLIANETAPEGFPSRGGGLYATSGASVSMSNTKLSENRADFGTAIYTLSVDADASVTNLDVEGGLIVNNGEDGGDGTPTDWSDTDTIRINGGEVKVDYTTIADNDINDSSANFNNSGELDLFSSIIHNSDGTLVYRGVDQGSTFPYECLMVNESGSLPAEPETVVDDPEFIDRVGGDFHLDAAISPAIDFCTTLNASTPDFNDSDNEERGFDDPLATNFQGPYDVGYDETYANDIIFEDGFE